MDKIGAMCTHSCLQSFQYLKFLRKRSLDKLPPFKSQDPITVEGLGFVSRSKTRMPAIPLPSLAEELMFYILVSVRAFDG